MNRTEIKNKLNKEYKGVKFILTSSMRTQLLISIYENPKKLEELRDEIQKPSATILHGLKELENTNFIKKINKKYELTSNGFLITANMIKLIENWASINKSKMFWNDHDLSDIPDDLLKNIYLLKNALYVKSTTSDLSNAFNTYIRLISHAKELKIILPIYSENHFKYLIKLLKSSKLQHMELIVSEEILNAIRRNDLFNEAIIENKKVKINCIKKELKLFLTYSDEFMSLTLFYNDGHYDDSQILIAKDDDAILWASKLYTNFKEVIT